MVKSNNISYISNFDIKKILVKAGNVELVIYPNKIDDAIKTVKYFIDENINFYPIGNFQILFLRWINWNTSNKFKKHQWSNFRIKRE